jgi:tetratricopeptide (TPR) repeat protein
VRKIVTTIIALSLGATGAIADTAGDCNQSDNLDLSIKACTELIEKYKLDNVNLAGAYFNRGNAYSDKKDYKAAIDNYGKAIELQPRNAGFYYNRGRAYRLNGQPDLAVASYSKAIELDPKDANALSNRGHAYRDLGNKEKAIADFRAALAINPTHDRALAHLKQLGVAP